MEKLTQPLLQVNNLSLIQCSRSPCSRSNPKLLLWSPVSCGVLWFECMAPPHAVSRWGFLLLRPLFPVMLVLFYSRVSSLQVLLSFKLTLACLFAGLLWWRGWRTSLSSKMSDSVNVRRPVTYIVLLSRGLCFEYGSFLSLLFDSGVIHVRRFHSRMSSLGWNVASTRPYLEPVFKP